MPAARPLSTAEFNDTDIPVGVVALVGETASHAPPLLVLAAAVYVIGAPLLVTATGCAGGVDPPRV